MEDAAAQISMPCRAAGGSRRSQADTVGDQRCAVVARLRAEYRPRSLTEELYSWRSAVTRRRLQTVERGRAGDMRTAASASDRCAGNMTDVSLDDLLLSTAITTEPLDRVARYRRGHERGLHLAIDKLGPARPRHITRAPLAKFPPTTSPRRRLRRVSAGAADSNPPTCPRCHVFRWHWLGKRKQFECSALQATTQFAARHGLRAFGNHVADLVSRDPRLCGEPVDRHAPDHETHWPASRATARNMLARIRAAYQAGNLACGLAGLATYPLGMRPPNPGIEDS